MKLAQQKETKMSNNKESLNEIINRLTIENERLKRASISDYAENMRKLEREAIEANNQSGAQLFEFCAKTAEQFLKNRG